MREDNENKKIINIEDVLYEQKLKIDNIHAPLELEDRLKEALDISEKLNSEDTSEISDGSYPSYRYDTANRTNKSFKWSKGFIAALITLVLIFSYSYDTLAYYGKRIIGYDKVVYGSVEALNEEGAGQEINKSHTFSNGVTVTLDGIMFDENELVAFYKVQSKNTKLEDTNLFMRIDGIRPLGYHPSGGAGTLIDDYTQMWVHSFQAPKIYEKWLSLEINMTADRKSETGKINFTLDRSKAMKRVAKQEIGKGIELEGLRINFLSLTASRLSTNIEGTMEPIPDSGQDHTEYSFENHPSLRFDIFVDDKYYSTAYAGVNFANKAEFSSEALGLPAEFKDIDIRNIRLVREEMVDKNQIITLNTKDLVIADDLLIREVYQDRDKICLKAVSRGIPIMGLEINGEQASGENDAYSNLSESREPVERVYQFQPMIKVQDRGADLGKGTHTNGDADLGSDSSGNMKLMVKLINYARYSKESIPIIIK